MYKRQIEHSEGHEEVYLVGIKRRGVPLAKMLKTNIESFSNLKVHLGELDITLYLSLIHIYCELL